MNRTREHLGTLVDDFARAGSQTAIVARSGLRFRRTSYGELAHMARKFAAELEKRGIVKGDRVLLCGENTAEWVAAFFGCVLRGVLPVPIDFGSSGEVARRVEREVTPKLSVGDRHSDNAPYLPFDAFSSLTNDELGAVDGMAASDPLQIIFTSGTTGDPKGVVHTHKNVLASLTPVETEMRKYAKYERLVHPIRILQTLPLSHVFGQFMGLWIPPLLGMEVHYEPRLVASELAGRIKKERISVLAAVPRVLDLMQTYTNERFPGLPERIERAKGSSALGRWWKFRDVHRALGFKFWAFVCGGASLPQANERFWNGLGFVVVQGYGMTETTALISLNHPFHAARGTIGQVLPGREVKLTADGEVLVRGDTISNATWHNGRLQQGADEWLATGDLAEFDEQGNLRFRGRKKDVIVTSAGLNIYPEDLEAALNRQAGVKNASVVELASSHGPEPVAVLLVEPERDAGKAVSNANRELADFQQIGRWVVWPEPDFPRTATGKVLRREIARRIQNGEIDGQGDADLNLDSLGRVELVAKLEEQFGVSLDDAALQNVNSASGVRALMTGGAREKIPHVYPHWPWNPLMQALRAAFLETITLPLVRALAKPTVRRQAKSWPTKPTLIVCNHATSYDVPFILYALPGPIRRRVAVAMSGEMILDWKRARKQGHWFLNAVAPLEYWLVTGLFNVFPLPQYSGFRRSFAHAGEAIDRGYHVLVFPEGRRSDDESIQPFKSGAGLLWNQLGTPAIPVRLRGLGHIKARGGRWFRSRTISVSVGDVLEPEKSRSPRDSTDVLERAVRNQ